MKKIRSLLLIPFLSILIGGSARQEIKPTNLKSALIRSDVPITDIKSGIDISYALNEEGRVYAWGNNANGELGVNQNEISNFTTPTLIETTLRFTQIEVGDNHVLGLTSSGELYTWGNNGFGQLGDGLEANNHVPTKTVNPSSFVKIWAKANLSFALANNGLLFGWGDNSAHCIIDNDMEIINIPMVVTLPDGVQVDELFLGSSTVIMRSTNNELYSWGSNVSGERGDGTFDTGRGIEKIESFGVNLKKASGYKELFYGISEGNVLYGWGDFLQFGAEPRSKTHTPIDVDFADQVKEISVARYGALLINEDGHLYSWGYNINGVLGNASYLNSTTPNLIDNSREYTKLAMGRNHALALTKNGEVLSFGSNQYGQLGHSEPISVRTPEVAGDIEFSKISSFGNHSLAIGEDSNLYFWGDNARFFMPYSNKDFIFTPTLVTDKPISFIDVALGDRHAVALDENGKLYTWGANNYGQLGNESTASASEPTEILLGTPFKKVAAGQNHCLAMRTDGFIYSWGDNTYGQLGDNFNGYSSIPLNPVPFLDVGASIYAGANSSFHISSAGTLHVCGDNSEGQLGTVPLEPIRQFIVASFFNGQNITMVASSARHTLFLREDGTVFACGYNGSGQLGTGGTISLTTPVPVSLWSYPVKTIAVGSDHSIALSRDNRLFAWGSNTFGQLGTGDNNQKLSPVALYFSYRIEEIYASGNYSMHLDSDRLLYSNGEYTRGQLGREDIYRTLVPTVCLKTRLNQTLSAPQTSYTKYYDDDKFNLNVTSDGTGEISYTSLNEEVVRVSSQGEVDIRGAGETTIEVSQAANLDYFEAAQKLIISIEVLKMPNTISAEIMSHEISLDSSPIYLNITSYYGRTNLVYTPKQEGIVTVDEDGKVTPIGAGQTYIEVYQEETSYSVRSNTLEILVVVNKLQQGITGQTSYECEYGSAPFALSLTSPAVGGQYSYESSDSEIVSVNDEGIVTPNNAGTATITVVNGGNDSYAESLPFEIQITVTKRAQTISSDVLLYEKVLGDAPFTVAFNHETGGAISCTSSNRNVATVTASGEVTMIGVGETTISVVQKGDANHKASNTLTIRLVVSAAPEPEPDNFPIWAIVLIVVGSVALLGAGGFLLYYFVFRKNKKVKN